MANTLKHKQSSVAGKVPTTTDLALGELAINTTDGKVYLKKNVSGTESVVEVAPVASVAGKTGAVTLAKGDVGLGNVDNTSDADKPISSATQTALDTKQPLDADLTAIAALAGTTGLLKKTAANTWALDTSTYLTGNQSISFSGDATGSGTTSVALTLANSGATAGTYRSVTVDAKGRVTGGSNPTSLSGYGITDAQALDADLTAIAALAGTSGFLKKTAANTWALDTSTYLTSAVTSVSGTAPIVSSGGNTPAISISAATTAAAGSMSATDKAKLDGIAAGATANTGTVTSVTGTAPISVATGTSTPAISISAATTLAAGSMSAADKSKLDGIASGATANTGTVTSVAVTVPTGLSVSGTPITSSGTFAISLAAGYSIPTTSSQTNWDTAYTDRNKWDGGSTGLTAATGRASLGLGTAAVMTGPSGAIVGTSDSQTLTNKTLTGLVETKTSPTISGNALTLDCSAGNVFSISLDADITTLSFSNAPATGTAYAMTLSFIADGTSRTVTWGTPVKWPSGTAPVMTSTSGKVDIFVLTTWDNGATWYAFTAGQNL